ncbi:MAG: hypothetical protein QOJ42_6190 [Acidobacteriaceae bacterium]|jgi:hypothetical protein|nr:hypothetical protein [Acidobacteriaceae bacterium]
MTELRRYHPHGRPTHGQMQAVGMTQDVECHRRRNPRKLAGSPSGHF